MNDDFLCLTEPPVKQLRGLRHLRLHVHHATYDHAFGWLITRLRRVFTVDISGPRLSSLMLATLRSTFCPGAAISAGRKLRTIAVAQARSACNGDLHGTALLSAVLSIVDRLPLSTHQVDFSGRRIDVEASLHDPKATLMDTDRLYGALFKLGDGSDVSASKVYGPRTIRWRLRDEEVMVLRASGTSLTALAYPDVCAQKRNWACRVRRW